MSDAAHTDLSLLQELFTIVICIDNHGRVVHGSPKAQEHMPALKQSPLFADVFNFVRPHFTHVTTAQLQNHIGSLFLLVTRESNFGLRGQLVSIHWNGANALCFCGSPWHRWIEANQPELKLDLADFAAHDSQLDQVFLMAGEQRMIQDLTNLNQNLRDTKQQLEKVQQRKDVVFARMSHEMRTPLSGVVSAITLLHDYPLPGKAADILALAEKSSLNLLHVLNYVLDVSKLEAGQSKAEKSPLSVWEITESVADIVRARALEKGLTLHWHCDSALESTREGDQSRLRQCLLNLVTNAIKFTEQGGVTIRAYPQDSDNSCVRFEVQDSGIGISPEDQAHVFKAFWSDDSPREDTDRGTGLGLDLVRRYVEAMEGTCGVLSQPSRGSLFWLEIPLPRTMQKKVKVVQPNREPVTEKTTLSGRVLLVDDNTSNMMLGTMILESLGLSVVQANNGKVALDKVLSQDFAVVMMDLNMPVMDGLASTRAIRQHRSSEELPILALTATASKREELRCFEAGMNDYMTKPIVRQRLSERLARWLSTSDRPSAGEQDPTKSIEASFEHLLDDQQLDSLCEQLGRDNFARLFEQFQHDLHKSLADMQRWETAEDYPAIKNELHTLHGICKSMGLGPLGAALAEAEQRFHEDETHLQNSAGMQELFRLIEDSQTALGKYRARLLIDENVL